jgi:hypothetical protein
MQYRLHESGLLSHVKRVEHAVCQAVHVVTLHARQDVSFAKWSVLICTLLIAEPLEYTSYFFFPASINIWIAASFASPLISCTVILYVDIEGSVTLSCHSRSYRLTVYRDPVCWYWSERYVVLSCTQIQTYGVPWIWVISECGSVVKMMLISFNLPSIFHKLLVSYCDEFYTHAQPPKWRTTPCPLSVTAYSIYSHLPSIAYDHFYNP